jgi:hypothetical protein
MPECEICYEECNKLKNLITCNHKLCFNCFPKIVEAATLNGSYEACCPFCRTTIKEIDRRSVVSTETATDEYEVEFWLNLDIAEWNVYSTTLHNGTEIIRTSHSSDPQPSWRNDTNVIKLKRHKQRKKYQRNRRITE